MLIKYRDKKIYIVEMHPNSAVKKTWKHFYSKEEAWDRLCNCNIDNMRRKAEKLAGSRSTYYELPVFTDLKKNKELKKIIEVHHDKYYLKLYMQEIKNYENLNYTPEELKILGPHGTIIIAKRKETEKSYTVATAFRRVPSKYLNNRRHFTEDEFKRNAREYFEFNTAKDKRAAARAILYLYHDKVDPADLALIAGWLKVLGDDGGTGLGMKIMTIAQQLPGGVQNNIIQSMDMDIILDGLADNLKTEDEVELPIILMDALDFLVLCEHFGLNSRGMQFIEDFMELFEWYEPQSPRMVGLIYQLQQILEPNTLPGRLWHRISDTVTQQVFSEALIESEPEEIPEVEPSTEDVNVRGSDLKGIISKLKSLFAQYPEKMVQKMIDELKGLGAITAPPAGIEFEERLGFGHAGIPIPGVSTKKTEQEYIQKVVFDPIELKNTQVFKFMLVQAGDYKVKQLNIFKHPVQKLQSGDKVFIFKPLQGSKCPEELNKCIEAFKDRKCQLFIIEV